MNIGEIVAAIRNNGRHKYGKKLIEDVTEKMRENSEWNIIRFRPNGVDLVQHPNPKKYMDENHYYKHPETGVKYYIPEDDFLVIRD